MKVEHKAHIVEIEVEHKACIVELETIVPGSPPVEHKDWATKLKGCAMTIDTHLVEMQKLLDETIQTWTNKEEIDGLIKVLTSL